jgi:hypothetical protein
MLSIIETLMVLLIENIKAQKKERYWCPSLGIYLNILITKDEI